MLRLTPPMTAAHEPLSYESGMNPPSGPYGLPSALQTLPHWSRVSDLGHPNHRHVLRRNRHSVSLSQRSSSEENNSSPRSESTHDDSKVVQQTKIESQIRAKQRIEYLEKSMDYLRSQHSETLRCLHTEVERLQRRNRELENSLLIPVPSRLSSLDVTTPGIVDESSTNVILTRLVRPPSVTHQLSVSSQASVNNEEDAKGLVQDALLLETSNDTSKQIIRRRRDRFSMDNNGQHAVTARSATPPPSAPSDSPHQPLRAFPPQPPSFRRLSDAAADLSLPYLPFNATVEPFQVQFGTNRPRPPTVLECQAIVRYLLADNIKQSNEIVKLKDSLQHALHPSRRRAAGGNTLQGVESASAEQLSPERFSHTLRRVRSTSRSVLKNPLMISLPPITAPVLPLVSQSSLFPRQSQHVHHERVQLGKKSVNSNRDEQREQHLPSIE